MLNFGISLFTTMVYLSICCTERTENPTVHVHVGLLTFGNIIMVRHDLSWSRGWISLLEVDEIVDDIDRDGEIDHPVHEVEAEEGDGENDPTVLVDVGGLHAEKSLRRTRCRRYIRRCEACNRWNKYTLWKYTHVFYYSRFSRIINFVLAPVFSEQEVSRNCSRKVI